MTMQSTKVVAFSVVVAALVAGCSRSAPNGNAVTKEAAAVSTPTMPNMQTAQKAEHMAEGTLNSVDQAAGRVNITHGPIASANWPGMTMSFKLANPDAVSDLKPGQRVEFHFTIESGMDATVTQIKSID